MRMGDEILFSALKKTKLFRFCKPNISQTKKKVIAIKNTVTVSSPDKWLDNGNFVDQISSDLAKQLDDAISKMEYPARKIRASSSPLKLDTSATKCEYSMELYLTWRG